MRWFLLPADADVGRHGLRPLMGLHIRNLCNAFVPDAALSPLLTGATHRTVARLGRQQEGLWVGDTVTASSDELAFLPNAMNVSLHAGLEPVRISIAEVHAVRCEPGWLTNIVVVAYSEGEFRFRCFGAARIARVLASHLRGR